MKKYDNKYDLMTKSNVELLILKLGIPTTISMLITNLYNMADTYFVGKLGTSASGATGVVFGLMAILQALGFMLGHGCGSIISRRLGAKDVDGARMYASTSFFTSLSFGAAVLVLGILFVNPLVRLLGSTPTILPYARTYAICILLAAPAMISSCVMNNVLRYEGMAFFAMIGLTSGSLLNIAMDALFIMKFGMGILGAGLATAISQYISAGILFSMFIFKNTQSKFSIKYLPKNFTPLFEIIKTGLPSLLRQGLGSASIMVLNHAAAPFGDAAIAGMSIVSRVVNFVFSVGLGIGQGFQPVAGFNFGAKKYSRVKRGFFFTWAFGTVLLTCLALVAFFNAEAVVRVFRDDPEVTRVGAIALKYQALSLIVIPYSVCNNMMFQSIGLNKVASFLSTLRSGICFIPVVIILSYVCGLYGVQISQSIADVLTSIICIPFMIRFFRGLPLDGEEYGTNS